MGMIPINSCHSHHFFSTCPFLVVKWRQGNLGSMCHCFSSTMPIEVGKSFLCIPGTQNIPKSTDLLFRKPKYPLQVSALLRRWGFSFAPVWCDRYMFLSEGQIELPQVTGNCTILRHWLPFQFLSPSHPRPPKNSKKKHSRQAMEIDVTKKKTRKSSCICGSGMWTWKKIWQKMMENWRKSPRTPRLNIFGSHSQDLPSRLGWSSRFFLKSARF